MAAYPNTIPNFSTKQNIIHVIDADHPNSLQAEVVAIALELGTSPRISTARAVTYANLDARIEALEADYRLKSDHDSHALLTGLAGDDHTQYTKVDGSRAFTGSTAITAAPVAVAAGDTQSQGALHTLARSDHRHAVAAATTPGTETVGQSAAVGVSAAFARADHAHGREAFGNVVTETAYGQSSGNGSAATVARSDHTHGSPALTSATPAAEDYSSTAVVGTGTLPAHEDHRHAMPALSSSAASTQAFGDAATVGIAAVPARGDHKHAMPALASTVTDERTWGITPTAGVAATAARGDHTHGSPDATLQGPSGCVAMWPTNTPPSGWAICDGSAVSRTTESVLFGIIGTTYGTGDGSTTFNLPNIKGRVVVGRDAVDTDWDTLGETRGAKTHTLVTGEIPIHNHSVTVDGNNFNTGGNNVGHVHWVNGVGDHTHSVSEHSVAGGDTGNRLAISYGAYTGQQPIIFGNTEGASAGTPHTHAIQTGTNLLFDDVDDHSMGGAGGHDHGNTQGENVGHVHNANHAHTGSSGTAGSGSAHNNIQPSIVLNFIIKK